MADRLLKVVIERKNEKVSLIIECSDVHAAMLFYQEMIEAARDGLVALTLTLEEPVA